MAALDLARSSLRYPSMEVHQDFRISAYYRGVGGRLTVRVWISALFCLYLFEECRRAEPDRKVGLTWQPSLARVCLTIIQPYLPRRGELPWSKEQTNY